MLSKISKKFAVMIFPFVVVACGTGDDNNPKINTIIGSETNPVVIPPKCPDWTKSGMWPNYQNVNHSNFRCSTVNNMGKMVADPMDLVRGRGDDTVEAGRTANSVNAYRASGGAVAAE